MVAVATAASKHLDTFTQCKPSLFTYCSVIIRMENLGVFFEQTLIMVWKHLEHKRLAGRSTLKDMLIPIALIVFWDYIFMLSNQSATYVSPVYDLRSLPPLSSQGEWVCSDPVNAPCMRFMILIFL